MSFSKIILEASIFIEPIATFRSLYPQYFIGIKRGMSSHYLISPRITDDHGITQKKIELKVYYKDIALNYEYPFLTFGL